MIHNFAFAGDVAPTKPGIYLATTDTSHCFSFFVAWFNGQYWYEYERGTDNPKRVRRKKTARLAITAWSHIDPDIFLGPLREGLKAPTDYAGRDVLRTEKQMWDEFRKSGIEHT